MHSLPHTQHPLSACLYPSGDGNKDTSRQHTNKLKIQTVSEPAVAAHTGRRTTKPLEFKKQATAWHGNSRLETWEAEVGL